MRFFIGIILLPLIMVASDAAFDFRWKSINTNRDSLAITDSLIDDKNYIPGTAMISDNLYRAFGLSSDSIRIVGYYALEQQFTEGISLMQPIGIDDIPRDYTLFKRTPKSSFQQSGSISRGFRIGSNRDLSIQSDFNFEAYGKIGKDIEIRAVLSDQASPIQPEGKTQSLSELEKVYIEAKSPHYGTSFGDIEMKVKNSKFLSITRSVKGVTGYVEYPSAGIDAAGAILDGNRTTQIIEPMEGNQGPYSLENPEGNSNITIIAGTEKVWLDGKPLIRGEQNDYIIDYNTAEIVFMPKKAISSYSRIVVDFEYASEDYQSSLYYGNGYIVQEGIFSFRTMGYFSSDRKDNPVGFDIDSDSEDALANIGDSPDSAYIPGWQDDSAGSYIMVEDSMGDFHFEWVGDSLGDYNVSFSRADSGSYVDSIDFYFFVGEGEGDFIPYRKVNLPKSLNVLAIQAALDTSIGFIASGELASSSFDQNTFSRLDDQDNIGYAANMNLRSPKIETGGGDFILEYDFFQATENFESPGRIYNTDFNRNWGISSEKENTGITMHLGKVKYLPSDDFGLRIGGGLRQDTDGEKANRIDSKVKYKSQKSTIGSDFDYAFSNLDEYSNKWYKTELNIKSNFGIISPELNFNGEDKAVAYSDSTLGERFGDFSARLGFDFEDFDIAPQAGFRKDFYRRDSLMPYSESYNAGISFDHKNIHAYISHRNFDALTSEAGTDLATNVADITFNHRGRKPKYNIRTSYRITGAASEKKSKIYTYVGEGNGDYAFDESRGYYIESGGEYILEYEGSGQFEPTSDLEISNRFRISSRGLLPDGFPGEFRLSLSTSSRQSLSERSPRGFIPQVWFFFNDSTIYLGQFKHQSDLSYDIGSFDFSLGQRYRKSANRRWTSGDELSIDNGQYIKSTLSMPKLKYSLRTDIEHSQDFYPNSSRRDGDIFTIKSSFEVDYTGMKYIVPNAEASVFYSENRTGASATGYGGLEKAYHIYGFGIKPGARISFQKGSILADFEYSKIESSQPAGIIPYEMAEGKRTGANFSWKIDASYKLTQNSIQTFSYIGENLPDTKDEHRFELKIQYLF